MDSATDGKAIEKVVTVQVPLVIRKKGGRKLILAPVASEVAVRPRRVDNTLVKLLARAFRWRALLDSGKFASIAALADADSINQSYVCRSLRLTLLAPEIVESILDGTQHSRLTLPLLVKSLPPDWSKQVELFGNRT